MADSYVIGLSRTNLLQISFGFNWDNGKSKIQHITYGARYVDEATLIPGKKMAYEILQEIKDNYNNIVVSAPTIFEACIHGTDIDPDELHIYEVNIGREVK